MIAGSTGAVGGKAVVVGDPELAADATSVPDDCTLIVVPDNAPVTGVTKVLPLPKFVTFVVVTVARLTVRVLGVFVEVVATEICAPAFDTTPPVDNVTIESFLLTPKFVTVPMAPTSAIEPELLDVQTKLPLLVRLAVLD